MRLYNFSFFPACKQESAVPKATSGLFRAGHPKRVSKPSLLFSSHRRDKKRETFSRLFLVFFFSLLFFYSLWCTGVVVSNTHKNDVFLIHISSEKKTIIRGTTKRCHQWWWWCQHHHHHHRLIMFQAIQHDDLRRRRINFVWIKRFKTRFKFKRIVKQ